MGRHALEVKRKYEYQLGGRLLTRAEISVRLCQTLWRTPGHMWPSRRFCNWSSTDKSDRSWVYSIRMTNPIHCDPLSFQCCWRIVNPISKTHSLQTACTNLTGSLMPSPDVPKAPPVQPSIFIILNPLLSEQIFLFVSQSVGAFPSYFSWHATSTVSTISFCWNGISIIICIPEAWATDEGGVRVCVHS